MPAFDRERPAYGIKTFTLGKLIIRTLAIDPKGKVANQLMRKESVADGGGGGGGGGSTKRDYADVVYEVMKERAKQVGTLSILEVNRRLDTVATCNNRARVEDELIALMGGMTAIDQKWLVRIVLFRVRIGLGQRRIMTLLHPMANDLYDRFCNLSKVCDIIGQPNLDGTAGGGGGDGLHFPAIEVGQPFRPMLCERIDISNLENLLGTHEYCVETKMDGERFQMHRLADGNYKYFSRNCYDYSSVFGAGGGDLYSGTLTPHISRLFKDTVSSLVLDGEMMVWNRDERAFRGKAENTDVKSLRTTDSTFRPCFCVYDILFLNGNCLLEKPYVERTRLLRTLLTEREGFLTVSNTIRIKDRSVFVSWETTLKNNQFLTQICLQIFY